MAFYFSIPEVRVEPTGEIGYFIIHFSKWENNCDEENCSKLTLEKFITAYFDTNPYYCISFQ